MKILHTADWHLGKRLDRFSRLEEQKLVLDEIITIADEQHVDMVLIAGDLFDNFNPTIEAIELFYKTLKRLSNNGKRPVIAIAGNHDAPDRIDAPNPLARECGIILIGHPNAVISPFEIADFKLSKTDKGFLELKLNHIDFPIRVVHTPYANEVRLKEYFGEEKETQLNFTLKNQWREIANRYCDEKGVNMLLTHLYMNGQGMELLEEPEGEKPLRIGNADMIFTDCIPPQIQYTALGHLHSFKNIGSEESPVVYSSSILCYSFSESGQTKYVSIINAEPHQSVTYEKIPLRNGRSLVRKTFNSVDACVAWLEEHSDALVELTIESETFLTATERGRIYASHQGIVHLIPKVKNYQFDNESLGNVNLNQNIEAIFKDYFKYKNKNQEPNEDIMALFNEILNYEK